MKNTTILITCGLLLTALAGVALFESLKQQGEVPYSATLKKIAEEINSSNTTWKARVNVRWVNSDIAGVKAQLGALEGEPAGIQVETVNAVADDLPESFDSREQWGDNCPSLWEVRDQSNCGSCWAFGAAESLSDRTCIHLGKDIRLSTENLVSCCSSCGNGCDGGYPISAMQYYVKTGLVTGDLYGTSNWCQAYVFAPCAHHVTSDEYPPCTGELPTPACSKSCDADSTYALPYSQDLHKGSKAYKIAKNQNAIKTEILNNGPIEVAFTVYEDFLTYQSGVYVHKTGKKLGGHAVKMVGWGVENGTPYWTVVNSWNNSWGDNGTFKIKRGVNECGIEAQGVAALPAN